MIGRKQETQPQPEQQYTKEEYASMKQAEREDAWAKVDAQAQEVFKDDASMKGFFDFMARCTPQSTRNLLILYDQNPEITHPRTFDKWKEAGRSIRSGEKGYTFFADQEYTKEDGTIANGYTITKAYDISQTRGPQPLPPQKHLPEEIIAAMVEQSPVQLAISFLKGYRHSMFPNSIRFLSATGWMKPPLSALSHVNRPMPASILSAAVTTVRRMRHRATVPLMWSHSGAGWILRPSGLTRYAKAVLK